MKKLLFSLLAVGSLMMGSCTKTGPVGPQGPTGNANVIGEDPFTVASSSWQYTTNSSGNVATYYADFTDNNITADVAAYGLVEIYKLYPNGVGWTNLPDIDGVTTTVYNFGTGGFSITILTTDGTPPNPPGTVEFRAVIIPSSVRIANPTVNWKNYSEAMTALAKAGIKVSNK